MLTLRGQGSVEVGTTDICPKAALGIFKVIAHVHIAVSSSLESVLYPSCSCHQSRTSSSTLDTLGNDVLFIVMSRTIVLLSGPSVKCGRLFLLPARESFKSTKLRSQAGCVVLASAGLNTPPTGKTAVLSGIDKDPDHAKDSYKQIVTISTRLPVTTWCESNILHDNFYHKHEC
ncbi:hypothetical protein C0J52_20863 [Blattella germanica]|nr:hypothetical protein C0J52_20863 [Blattella germanica]